jgi:outer membrane murein-binding lipoprotein Lpp
LQLDEATASLVLKTSLISELETQVDELKATLGSIAADLEASRQNLEGAERGKATAEKEVAETRITLAALQGERDKLEQVLDEVRPYLSSVVACLLSDTNSWRPQG